MKADSFKSLQQAWTIGKFMDWTKVLGVKLLKGNGKMERSFSDKSASNGIKFPY